MHLKFLLKKITQLFSSAHKYASNLIKDLLVYIMYIHTYILVNVY